MGMELQASLTSPVANRPSGHERFLAGPSIQTTRLEPQLRHFATHDATGQGEGVVLFIMEDTHWVETQCPGNSCGKRGDCDQDSDPAEVTSRVETADPEQYPGEGPATARPFRSRRQKTEGDGPHELAQNRG
jgi:hypothetical protein